MGARLRSWPGTGVAVTLALITMAIIVPAIFDWNVHASSFPPLHAKWRPRFGPGTVPALAIGFSAVIWAPGLAARLTWARLLLVSFAAALGWSISLAAVDGRAGLGPILGTPDEYLPTARRVTSVPATLHHFVSRIPATSAHPWSIHVSAHPPAALLFFVALTRLGLGSDLLAGLTVILLAATIPVAVLITVQRLSGDAVARRVAPILVVGPSAVWLAVSADAVFAAVAAWTLCCLAVAATTTHRSRPILISAVAGLLLGCCVMLSYGLPLLAILAVAVLGAAHNLRPLSVLLVAAIGVILGFAAVGFSWWDAYPVLRARYDAGIASQRPAAYWLWGDLAALALSAGPVLGASVALGLRRSRLVRRGPRASRPIVILTLAACACIVLADVSLMSKAETERIWLPFVPWLLLGTALLPDNWRRRALTAQVVMALVIQSLLTTTW